MVGGEAYSWVEPKMVERALIGGIFKSLVIMKIAPLPVKSSGNDGAIVAGSAFSASQPVGRSSLVLGFVYRTCSQLLSQYLFGFKLSLCRSNYKI